MKFFAVIAAVCVGAASAMPQMGGGAFDATAGMAPSAGATAGAAAATGPAAAAGGLGLSWGNTKAYGPKAYGPGLNNPWAVPVNEFQMQSMLNLAEQFPHLLVRADVDGELSFTNRFGMEVDHPYENLGEAFDF